MPRFLALALLLGVVAATAPLHAAEPADVPITTCGQVVPKRALGYLTADLDCTGFTGGPANVYPNSKGAAVYLEKKSRLDLRGFTLTGGGHGVQCDALECDRGRPCSKGPCEVFNGTLVSSAQGANGVVG